MRTRAETERQRSSQLQGSLSSVREPTGDSTGFLFNFTQLESTLREKSQQLESLLEIKINLEEQLKKETAAKVIFLLINFKKQV